MAAKLKLKKSLILVIIISLIILLGYFIYDKSNKNYEEGIDNENNNNVEYEYEITRDSKIVIKLINNNSFDLEGLNININYYDKKNNLIVSENKEVMYILANGKYIMGSYLPNKEEEIIYPDKVKIHITKLENVNYESAKDKLNITHNQLDNGNIITEYTNNSDKELFVQTNIIYYKKDKIVACNLNSDFVEKGKNKVEEFKKVLDENENFIEYDSYELYSNAVIYDEEISTEITEIPEEVLEEVLD